MGLLGIVHRRFSMRVAYLPRMPAPQWMDDVRWVTLGRSTSSMCGSMQSELDRHAAAACTGDAAANHAEAARHCGLMRDWLAREQTGVNSMSTGGGMMGGGRCSR